MSIIRYRNDVYGIERSVMGFSKVPDKHGGFLMQVDYVLQELDFNDLKKVVMPREGDFHLSDAYDLNEEQLQWLQQYVDEDIDFQKYDYRLECFQAPGAAVYWNQKIYRKRALAGEIDMWNATKTMEVDQRQDALKEFYAKFFADAEDIVSFDDDTFYALYRGDPWDAQEIIFEEYGVHVEEEDFEKPIWQLIDKLHPNKS